VALTTVAPLSAIVTYMGESDAHAVRPTEKTIELTLTITGHYDPPQLIQDWTPDHAYGPVERVMIEREMHSAKRTYDIIDANATVVTDD
jgi:hypothetical protein